MKIFSLLISNLIYLSHWILMFQLLQETACFFPWWMGARVQSSSELVLHNHLLMNQIFWPTITKLSEHTRIFVYQGTRLARDESQTINNNATIIADWIYIYTISCDVQNHIYYLNEHFCIVCPIIRQIVNFMEILVEIYNNKVRSRNQCNGQVKEIKGWNYSYLLNWFDEGGCLHYLPMK